MFKEKIYDIPTGKVDIILDTDAYNEIDDQYAIALMVKWTEKFNIRGITAAPFLNSHSLSPKDGMEKSFFEIKKLLKLLKRTDLQKKVYSGATDYLIDETTPQRTKASNFIIEEALKHTADNPLYVVGIGAITNIASAILSEPKIINSMIVIWLGGHAEHALNLNSSIEFNLRQDIAAARAVFNSNVPIIHFPCMGVVESCRTTKYELAHFLKGKNEISNYLYENTVREVEEYEKNNPERAWSRPIWDLTTICWFSEFGTIIGRIKNRHIPQYDGTYKIDKKANKIMVIEYVNRDKVFNLFFEKITK